MKKRKYSKWEQKRAIDMFDLMEKAEDTANDLKGDYYKASVETETDAVKVAKKFQLSQHLTNKEADRIMAKVNNPDDLKETLVQMKKSELGAEIASEVEAPANVSKLKELKSAMSRMSQRARGLFNVTKIKTDDVLEQIAKESFDREAFSIQQQVGEAVPLYMKDSEIKRVIKREWHGKSYSQNIWENTEKLSKTVKQEMIKSVLTGKSLDKIAKEISKKFSGSYNEARRLVRTEACFVTNQIQLEVFRKAGVEWYIYSAILDERTSDICRGLDGSRHRVKDATVGLNFPPMHPWCRSSVVPVIPKSLREKLRQKARSFWGKIKRIPESMRFSEWLIRKDE